MVFGELRIAELHPSARSQDPELAYLSEPRSVSPDVEEGEFDDAVLGEDHLAAGGGLVREERDHPLVAREGRGGEECQRREQYRVL